MQELTDQVKGGAELSADDVENAAQQLLDESADPGAKAEFLKAFAAKGETPGEIAAFVDAFLKRAVDPGLSADDVDGPMLDVCGTGGDKLNLFNVSTTCIFVLAAAGISVVKHGNRGITSKSGGADVLEALGIRIDLPPEEFAACVKKTGLGFLFAQMYHPAFKAVGPVRAQLAKEGQRTVFNILGPLLNPVRPAYQLVGVFDPNLPPAYAAILQKLGRKNAWVVHGTTADGGPMDELSTLGPTTIAKTSGDLETIDPRELGFHTPKIENLQGGDAAENAEILTAILDGSERGPKRDLVVLNSAAGLAIAGKTPDLKAGIALAEKLLDSGAAKAKLEAMKAFSA
ncbi:MAG: anthranilate phosphoribosyltransferase [Verrucomicrobiota bacterium]